MKSFTLTVNYDTLDELLIAAQRLHGTGRELAGLNNGQGPAGGMSAETPKDKAPGKPKATKEDAASPPTAAPAPAATAAPSPSPASAPAPAPAPAPTSAAPDTLAQLQAAVQAGIAASKRDGVAAVLKSYGATKASGVPADKQAEAVAKLKALLEDDMAG